MGPVNVDAIEEYDELEERHNFLRNQHDDLVSSKTELLSVIERINDETQRRFSETFAQVRINFRDMFKELFGEKGQADLTLLDESDPLESGIEVIAKPPGKKLQSITLLSGGERSMTAVALLFSIYMIKPSPFCVLDELDAPLDESNINRFVKVLDRFIDKSQFIIVTHSKRTMARADVMYGVTMEEFGVSKPVGMRLTASNDDQKIEAKSAAQKAALRLSMKSKIGKRIPDGAYETMLSAVKSDTSPALLVMRYDMIEWMVRDLIVIPSFALTEHAIIPRKPLSVNARRAGWIGCNIDLSKIAPNARVRLVEQGVAQSRQFVTDSYARLRPLQSIEVKQRNWTLAVLNGIENLPKRQFTTKEAYQMETAISQTFPRNKNIRPKIRQQLQVLRDLGIIKHLERGLWLLPA